jgi:hypothetical protein
MTAEAQIALNNGMLIGMATKGFIKGETTIIGEKDTSYIMCSSNWNTSGTEEYPILYTCNDDGVWKAEDIRQFYHADIDGVYHYNATTEYPVKHNGIFYMHCRKRQIYTSMDGSNWEYRGMRPANLSNMYIGNEKIIMTAYGTSYSNSINLDEEWTRMQNDTGIGFEYSKTAYGNGVFVTTGAESSGGMLYSDDAISWKSGATLNTSKLAVIFNGDEFVLFAYQSTQKVEQIYTSNDGITWELIRSAATVTPYAREYAFGNNKYMKWYYNSSSQPWYKIYLSTDLITWTQVIDPEWPNAYPSVPIFSGSAFLLSLSTIPGRRYYVDEENVKLNLIKVSQVGGLPSRAQ